jgi:hypothetical protein
MMEQFEEQKFYICQRFQERTEDVKVDEYASH